MDITEGLRNWAEDIKVEDIDVVLEYLHDQNMLNEDGEILAKGFWERYIKEDAHVSIASV